MKDAPQFKAPSQFKDAPEYFIQVPLTVLGRRDINSSAKLLFGLIANLSRKFGYCNATNAYLAERMGVKPDYVSHLIADLESKQLVRSLIYAGRGNERHLQVSRRYISGPDPLGLEAATSRTIIRDPLGLASDQIDKRIRKEKDSLVSYSSSSNLGAEAGKQKETGKQESSFDSLQEAETRGTSETTPSPAFREAHQWLKQKAAKVGESAGTLRDDWNALPVSGKAAFLTQAQTELRRAGAGEPSARSIEARAFNLWSAQSGGDNS